MNPVWRVPADHVGVIAVDANFLRDGIPISEMQPMVGGLAQI